MEKIKIFLSYHKKSTIIQNNILTPIHVGRELAKNNTEYSWLEENMIGDNTGENISAKNPNYCELTAQYWVWKNCESDYVGFMHYRRHLNFNLQKIYDENIFGLSSENYLNEFYIEKYGLDEENLNKVISQCDIITVEQWDVKNAGSKNNYDHYKNSDKKLHIEDYDRALNILRKKYPEFEEDIKTYNDSQLGYYTNIYIMRQHLFNEYCSWLFDILFELEKQTNISNYDYQEARIYGYISEWLFGIYIYHLKRTSNLKIKELQRTVVNDCNIVQDDKNINICFATDNNYIQHLGVSIASLLVNTKTEKTIDLYVLNDGNLKKKNKNKLKEVIKLKDNVNLYFLTVNKNIFKDFFIIPNSHFSVATYYRYIVPSLLYDISKVLYLDCDICVKGDIEELFNINLGNNYIAGAQDIIGRKNQERLSLDKSNYYINAGVLVMNLAKMRQDKIQNELINCTLTKRDLIYWQDQDVINMVMENNIKYIDLAWNFQYYYPDSEMDFDREMFNKALKNPKIIHFIGSRKPWDTYYRTRPNAEEYFEYLKLTPWKSFGYKYRFLKILKMFFSIEKTSSHKILFVLGIKFKFKRKKGKPKIKDVLNELKNIRTENKKINTKLDKLLETLNQGECVNAKNKRNNTCI